MPSRPFLPAAAFALFLLFVPSGGSAQQTALGPSFSLMVGAGEGVSGGGCGGAHYIGSTGLDGSRRLGKVVSLQVAVRAFWLALGPECNEAPTAPLPPPPDGTYIEGDGVQLQSSQFFTTDARLGIRAPHNLAMLTIGGGTVLRRGYEAPYFVGALSFPFADGSSRRFSWLVEYYLLRLTNDRFQRTYQNGFRVAEQPLGPIQRWSNAMTLGVRWGFRL
jgi:hypothetical protein